MSSILPYIKKVNDFLDAPFNPNEMADEKLYEFPELIQEVLNQKPIPHIGMGGWTNLFNAVGGLRKREFSIICGPSGYGKTTFLANLAAEFVGQGTKSFISSVEIGPHEFAKKVMASLAGTSTNSPNYKEEVEAFLKRGGTMKSTNHDTVYTKFESRINHRTLMAYILWAFEAYGTEVAVIDNFNYIYQPTGKAELVEMDRVIHEWVQIVKLIPIHIFMVNHPRKTDNGRVDSMYDIKGSSTAIQEAQNVFLFNKLSEDLEKDFMDGPRLYRELKIAKCRFNGQSVGSRIIYRQISGSEKYEEIKTIQ